VPVLLKYHLLFADDFGQYFEKMFGKMFVLFSFLEHDDNPFNHYGKKYGDHCVVLNSYGYSLKI
jgi:hypothetical protein